MKIFIKSIYPLHKTSPDFFNGFQKQFITCLLICLAYGASFFASAEHIEETWLFFREVNPLTSPVKITLKGNEVDMSSLIPALERAKQSPFDNFLILEKVSFPVISEKLSSLCKKSNLPSACTERAVAKVRKTLDGIHQHLENQILYPMGYHPINSERVQGFFKNAMGILDSECLGNCEDYDLLGAIRYSSQEQYPQLYDKIKTTDEKCQRNILNALAEELKKQKFPKRCLKEENKKHPVCESMSKDINIVRGRILRIAELAYGPDVFKTTEAQATCLDCANKTKREDESFNLFSDLIKDIQEQSQCFELKPGQEKRVYSGTGSGRSYNMKRGPDGTYSIPLNLRFSADDDYDGDIPKDEVPTRYMKKVQECINTANEKMLGPNGEKLKIVIQEPAKQTNNRCENEVEEIKVGSKEHRSNAGKYESDIDCPIITHEILHLLGLCDEYKEKKRGHYVDPKTGEKISSSQVNSTQALNYVFKPAYKCRIVTTNSIMADQQERWDNVFKEGKNNSLLTPGQFNAILYGSCERKNQIFNKCAQLAYRSTGAGLPNCTEEKQQCETQNIRGLSKAEEIKRVQEEIEETKKYRAMAKGFRLESSVEAFNEKLNSLRERLKVVESWP